MLKIMEVNMNNDKHSIFVERMKNINPNIRIIGKYQKALEHIEVECLVCGHIWNPTPNKLLIGRSCPECAKEIRASKQRKTHEQFVKDVAAVNPNINICSKYFNSTTKVELECKICNHHWFSEPNNILEGRGCPNCKNIKTGNRCRKPYEQFIFEVKKRSPDVKILGEYINNRTKIKTECLLCGNIWMANPDVLLRGCACPECNTSKGEKRVKEYLDNKGVQFTFQKSYTGLLGNGGFPLLYDFYIPQLNLLIEYQGQQHEHPVDFKGRGKEYAEKCFRTQQEHDERKRKYAQSHNINLLEIWYWDYENIEKILDKYIGENYE